MTLVRRVSALWGPANARGWASENGLRRSELAGGEIMNDEPSCNDLLRIDVHLNDDAIDRWCENVTGEIERVVLRTLELFGINRGRVEVAVVDDSQIHQINQTQLGHDWETDVITFPYEFDEDRVEGELIVSWETALRESQVTGWPELTELLLYCIHGALHLVGFDDLEPDSRLAMRGREREIVELLGLEGWEKYDVDAVDRREAKVPEGDLGS